jgi:hypothetical protein
LRPERQVYTKVSLPSSMSQQVTGDLAQPNQAAVYAALAAQSSFRKPRAPTAAYSSFAQPQSELISASSAGSSSRVNSRRVYCSREACGSLILLEKAGDVVEASVDVVSLPTTWQDRLDVLLTRQLPHDAASPFDRPANGPADDAKSEKAQKCYLHVPHFNSRTLATRAPINRLYCLAARLG